MNLQTPIFKSRAWGPLGLLLVVDIAVPLLQKAASKSSHGDDVWDYYLALLANASLWIALALAPLQLLLWTIVLKRCDLGWAYPITALAYPLTMFAAAFCFGERYDWHVWTGAMLITLGAAVLGPPEHTGAGPDSLEIH